jgi:hypothetical protein
MDEEAKQLLREIRDIGLRNETRVERDMALRRRVFMVAFVALVIALGALIYLLRIVNSMDPQPAGTHASLLSQAPQSESRRHI